MLIEGLVIRYGVPAIVVGTFFEGETILVIGGALAHRGLLHLPYVLGAAFVGSVLGDQTWFRVGRHFGKPFIERRPKWQARAKRIDGWLARFGIAFVMGFRFIYGIRTVTPVFLGARGYPWKKFLILDSIGGAVWSTAFGCGGYALGASLARVLGRASRIEEMVLAGIVVTLVIGLLVKKLRERNETAKATALEVDRGSVAITKVERTTLR